MMRKVAHTGCSLCRGFSSGESSWLVAYSSAGLRLSACQQGCVLVSDRQLYVWGGFPSPLGQ